LVFIGFKRFRSGQDLPRHHSGQSSDAGGGHLVDDWNKPPAQRAALHRLQCIVDLNPECQPRLVGAFYRRLVARIGKAKAVTTTARKIALFYNAMRLGIAYQDPGADYYESKYRERADSTRASQAPWPLRAPTHDA
jgi:hypothetical protein